MKLFKKIIIIALISTFVLPLSAGAEFVAGRIIGVNDGDTVVFIDTKGNILTIRFAYTDAREIKDNYHGKADLINGPLRKII